MSFLDLMSDAQPAESRHTLTIFCRYENPEHTVYDGQRTYRGKNRIECVTDARQDGWTMSRDDRATCPLCNRLLSAEKERTGA